MELTSLYISPGALAGCLGQALSPVERWQSAREGLVREASKGDWYWLIAAVAVIVGGGVILAIVRRDYRRKHAAERFRQRLDDLELTVEQRHALKHLVGLSEAENPAMVLSIGEVFERAVDRFERSEVFQAKPPLAKQRIYEVINALRRKLGFDVNVAIDEDSPSTKQMQPGDRIAVMSPGGESAVHGRVAASNPRHVVLKMDAKVPSPLPGGWVVRYTTGGVVWEFVPELVKSGRDSLMIAHSKHVRMVNRRQYPRARTSRIAYVARYPFVHVRLPEDPAPAFQPARLTEIGGPGLRIESDLPVAKGEKILIVLKLYQDKAIQGVGTVNRVISNPDGSRGFIADMVGLSKPEISQLLRETSAAARQSAALSHRSQERDLALTA